jgi:peptide/nickel transport system permease protein
MVKEVDLKSFVGQSSILSVEQVLLKQDFYLGTDKYGRDSAGC